MRHRLLTAAVACTALLLTSTAGGQQISDEPPVAPLAGLGTAFTYQGRLTDGGNPATGVYDLQLKLYDAATTPPGVQVGGTVIRQDVTVTDGLLTTDLDFGAGAFSGQALWLEIGVRPGASTGAFTLLSFRQPVGPTPFAHYSKTGVATDVQCAGCVSVGDLAGGSASNGQVLTATGASSMAWQSPASLTGTGSNGQVAFWSGASSLGGSGNLYWDNANARLSLGDAAAGGIRLDMTGMLRMPVTAAAAGTATAGVLFLGADRFLHAYGPADAGNTFLGQAAGNFTTTFGRNTGIGYQSLSADSTGSENTAVGYQGLKANTYGNDNTAVGANSLTGTTEGSYNSGLGSNSLFHNTLGTSNIAIGHNCMLNNTTAGQNTAVGIEALKNQAYSNGNAMWGSYNTAVGFAALKMTQPDSTATGIDNTAVGGDTLGSNTTGGKNTAVGRNAGKRSDSVTGYAGGTATFVPLQTGWYNTFLGWGAGATVQTSNCTAVGVDAYCDGDNQVRVGNTWITSIGGKVAWSALSDLRAKRDVRELDLGLDFVLRLRPVSYRLRQGNGRTDMGFVAQDIEALLGDSYNVLDIGGDAARTLSLRHTDLIAPLVKAVQEQQAEIEAQRSTIEEQRALLDAQRSLLDEMLRRLEAHLGASGTDHR